MIHLPSKPEVQEWKRGQVRPLDLHERLGYAHTLAQQLARDAVKLRAKSEAFGVRTETGQWYAHFERETWRRYDRVTRFLYQHTAMY